MTRRLHKTAAAVDGALGLVRSLGSPATKAKSPAGAFVLLAAEANASAAETAAAVGLEVDQTRDLVRAKGRAVGTDTLQRLEAWLCLRWLTLAPPDLSAARSELLARAWGLAAADQGQDQGPEVGRRGDPPPCGRPTSRGGQPPRNFPSISEKAMKVQFFPARIWHSQPPGLVIGADSSAAYVDSPSGRLVQMQRVRPDRLALVDVAICEQVTAKGPVAVQLAVDQAEEWARNMQLNTHRGAVAIGPVLVDAWKAHQELRQ